MSNLLGTKVRLPESMAIDHIAAGSDGFSFVIESNNKPRKIGTNWTVKNVPSRAVTKLLNLPPIAKIILPDAPIKLPDPPPNEKLIDDGFVQNNIEFPISTKERWGFYKFF